MKHVNDIEVIDHQEINPQNPSNMNSNNNPFAGLSDQALAEEIKRREAAKEGDRRAYKKLVSESVPGLYKKLFDLSQTISAVKTELFSDFNSLLTLKKDAYGIKDGQQSHTFSDEDGNSITIGYRVTDGWDDTVGAGIAKVNKYIESLAKDKNSAMLVASLNRLLKKDAKGNLKASRVVEMQQMAEEFSSDLFNDGISIIVKAYKPVKSCYFIEASYQDETGTKVSLPLSISAAKFEKDAKLDLSIFQSLKSE